MRGWKEPTADKESTRVVSSRWRSISLLLIGLLAGSLLVETASAHLTTFRHVKQSHFYTKRVANKRFVKANERPWAVVAADGSLVEGSHVASATRSLEGNYVLEFNRNVSDCAVVSALGGYPLGPGFNTGIPGGMVGATVRGSGPPKNRQVAVVTRLTDGTVTDRSFHLAVIC